MKSYRPILKFPTVRIAILVSFLTLLIGSIVSISIEQSRTPFSNFSLQSEIETLVIMPMPDFGELPNFAAYASVDQMKTAFFAYIEPMVVYNNAVIRKQRQALTVIYEKFSDWNLLGAAEQNYVLALAEEYDLEWYQQDANKIMQELMRRVDLIPVSLALVQAAKESGWGRSRFAVEANNIFGQWCYSPNCGLVPERRIEGATNQVKKFSSIALAIYSYMNNLNTHTSYEELRSIRADIQAVGNPVTAAALAEGLIYYSQRREVYVEEIKIMLRQYQVFKEGNQA